MKVVSKSLVINLIELIESDAALMVKFCEVDQNFKGTSNQAQALSSLLTIQRIKQTLNDASFDASINYSTQEIA